MSGLIHAAPPTFDIAISPNTIGPGSTSTLTYTINNTAETTAVTGLSFSDTLPTGVTIATPERAITTCHSGVLTAVAGTNTITFSDYRLSSASSCTLALDITSLTVGTHDHTTSTLSTSAGSVGTANASLTVDSERSGLLMAFAPSTINQGELSQLTFTFDNSLNTNNSDFLVFINTLPTGLLIADEPGVATSCNGGNFPIEITAKAGAGSISLKYGFAGLGANCTVSVNVTASNAGQYVNVSGEASENGANTTGISTALLTVINPFLNANFPAAVAVGTSVNLTYTLNNADRYNTATDITFTNDLNATLSGLTATTLPASGFCGPGSTITGSSMITVFGANLASGTSCSFTLTVLIPVNAAVGAYTNTTSTVNLTLGSSTTKPALSHNLLVNNAPRISMAFIDDPVNAGNDVTLRFTVDNLSTTYSVSEINFTLETNVAYSGMVIKTLPSANSCGVGSTYTFAFLLGDVIFVEMTDGLLLAGESCNFEVIFTLPEGGISGRFLFTSSAITGTINSTTVTGNNASDSLEVLTGPRLSIDIEGDSAEPGSEVIANLTLEYGENAIADISNVAFTIDLDSALTGLTLTTPASLDVCGLGSSVSGTSILTFTGGSLAAKQKCSFPVTLQIPTGATASVYTLTSSTVTGIVAAKSVNASQASASQTVTGLTFSKLFLTNPVSPGDAVTARYSITNSANAPAASSIDFTDNLNLALSSLTATSLPTRPCGVSSIILGTDFLLFYGGDIAPGETCTFDVPLTVPSSTSAGTYNSATSDLIANVSGSFTSTPNAVDTLFVDTLEVLITSSKSSPTEVSPIPISIYFTRAVTDFIESDLLITNGVISNFSGSDLSYSADITPNTFGSVVITLPVNSVNDAVFAGVQNASQSLTIESIDAPSDVAVTVPATAISTLGTSYDVSGTHRLDASKVFLYSDTNNNGVADNATPLASDTVAGGIWSLRAPLSSHTSNNFVVGWQDREKRFSRVINVPTITQFTATSNFTPQINGTPATNVVEGENYIFTPAITDGNPNDTHIFSIINQPSWATFRTSTGTLRGTPSRADAGDYTDIMITVKDNSNASASLPAFAITVTKLNVAPVANNQTLTLEEDSKITIVLSSSDADEDTLIYVIVTEPEHGVLTQSNDNTWKYTADENFNGTDQFSFKVMDSELDSESATITLTINPVNDAPIALDDNIMLTYSEEGRYVLDVLANDSDIDEDTITLVNASSSIGTVSIDDGKLIYRLDGVIDGSIEFQYVINDGHTSIGGARVTLNFDNVADALLPVISLPSNININANGLFTKVDLGVATAVDSNGERIPVTLVSGITHFAPGTNLVYWKAQDSEGFSRIATQVVTINPLINIAKDRQGTEGKHYQVAVYLNGDSPYYPITVSYTVNGNSDSDDHNLAPGELVIESGLIGYIEFYIISDTIAEMDETLVITLDSAMNVGEHASFTLTITEDNVAPQVSINVSQNNQQRTLIDNSLGDVVITANVTDANSNDTHSYTWTSTSGELIDIDPDAFNNSFTFDPTSLPIGQQSLSLTITDNGTLPLSTEVFVYLDIVDPLSALSDFDSDGDLIPDNAEGYGDEDNDGIPNYLDNNSRCNIQPGSVNEAILFLIETESDTCLRKGVNTANNNSGSILLNVNEVLIDSDTINVGGIFDFIIYQLSEAGQYVSVVLPLHLPIPDNAVYRKLSSDYGWVDFAVDSKNYYSSVIGERGYCPAPNDDSWTIGLTAGHWCVQLTIEDGGSNDDDGIANNQIVDPGGVAIWNNNNTFPTITSEQVTVTQNNSILIDVLKNDTDSDGDSLTITSANVDFGSVSINDQLLYYQPEENFFGLAIISYGVSDGNNGTGYGEVSVDVIENTAPTTIDDTASTDDRTTISIDVLSNDSDIDNDELTLTSATAVQGSITIDDNILIYTPLPGFDGIDTVTYTINDNNGGESQGIASITVQAYETITVTNESSGGSTRPFILLIGSIILFIRRKSTLTIHKAAKALMLKTLVRKSLTQYLGLLTLLTLSSHAEQAFPLSYFVNVELGQNKIITSNITGQVSTDIITQVEDSATGWSLGLGVNIPSHISITLSYMDMGQASLSITSDTLNTSEYHQSVSQLAPMLVNGFALDGRYHFLVGEHYSASALVGLLSWDNNVTSTYEHQRIENKQAGVDMFYGIEGAYTINDTWTANVGLKNYALEKNKINTAYLGLTYQF